MWLLRVMRQWRSLYVMNTPPFAPRALIGTPEAARILGKSLRTVHRMVAAGALAPVVTAPGGPHGAYLFDRAEIERLAKADAA